MGLRRLSDQVAERVTSANSLILDIRAKQRSPALVVQRAISLQQGNMQDSSRQRAFIGKHAKRVTFLSKQLCLFVQAPLLAEVEQILCTLKRISLTGPPDLGLALVTEFQRLTVTFFTTSRPIHTAFPGGTVRNAQHMSRFVNRRLQRSSQA